MSLVAIVSHLLLLAGRVVPQETGEYWAPPLDTSTITLPERAPRPQA